MNIKGYFSFTRGEKRGTVVLLLIVVILIAANFSVDLLKSNHQTDFSEFESEIDAFEKELNIKVNQNETLSIELFKFNPNTISDEEWKKLGFVTWQIKTINNYKAKGGVWRIKSDVAKIYGLEEAHFEQLSPFILLPNEIEKENSYHSKKKNSEIEYFKFDPNTISKDQWVTLGFKDWQIKTIFNFKAKGGSWKTKADVKKIYGLDESDYSKLESYILLPDNTEKKDYTSKVNVNTADAEELTNLKGIHSEKYAKIIVKYRNELGGFVQKEQLKEVWNLTEEIYTGFEHQLELGNSNPKQLNINKVSANELKIHPYINWNTANAIVKYRKANGNFKNIEDLKKIHIINNESYLRIAPYLTTN